MIVKKQQHGSLWKSASKSEFRNNPEKLSPMTSVKDRVISPF